MNAGIPILEGRPPSDEETRLVAFFEEAEKKQLELINEAGKRIIELSTALLGVLFTVSAFGEEFPPAYLVQNLPAQVLVVAALLCYLLALGAGLLAVQPRAYNHWEHDLTEMRREKERLIHHKVAWFRAGSLLFGAGCLCLAALVVSIIL